MQLLPLLLVGCSDSGTGDGPSQVPDGQCAGATAALTDLPGDVSPDLGTARESTAAAAAMVDALGVPVIADSVESVAAKCRFTMTAASGIKVDVSMAKVGDSYHATHITSPLADDDPPSYSLQGDTLTATMSRVDLEALSDGTIEISGIFGGKASTLVVREPSTVTDATVELTVERENENHGTIVFRTMDAQGATAALTVFPVPPGDSAAG